MSIVAKSNQVSTITVPFHGDNLLLVPFNGEPYVPMKPIVEGIGLVWAAQFVKIKSKFAKGVSEIEIPSAGGAQLMTCLPLRKLPAWLYSIQPNKVAPELKEKIVQYQEECDEVLWQYWTTGSATKESVSKTQQPKREQASKTYLPERRKAQAMKWEAEALEIVLKHTTLSPEAKQVCVAKAMNDIAGFEVIPLPLIEDRHYSATEVGEMLGCSANKIGKVAIANNLKTNGYGKTFLDKSPFSSKQVETFRYNSAGVAALKQIIIGEDAA